MVDVKIPFVKMHGAGNDFVMIDDREGTFPSDDPEVIASLAARRTGIGSEGVILVQRSDRADFRMRFFNPDGGEAEMCGNGARCVAAFAREIGAAGNRMRFETGAGTVEAEVVSDGEVKVFLPPPSLPGRDFVNTGVPHKIVAVADLASVDVEAEGRKIRMSGEFAPAGTNVDFVRYLPPHTAEIRTYERGVEAESGACGTGAAAAAVIGVDSYGMEFPVSVRTALGYTLAVDAARDAEGRFSRIGLTGPVSRVYDGVIDLDRR